MLKKKPKPDASVVVMGCMGVSDRETELYKYIDRFEGEMKKYAKLHNLKIEGSFWVWELK